TFSHNCLSRIHLLRDDFLFINRLRKPWTLQGTENLFKKVSKEAGLLSVYSIHSTRHCYGFLTYSKSKNIRLTQTLLGHSSISTTMIYAHVDPGEMMATIDGLWT
ncbi:tyrosine-type recombinase/integrase, partial [Thermodesulfobacteriota bacterium]